jgi:hypothetical protein
VRSREFDTVEERLISFVILVGSMPLVTALVFETFTECAAPAAVCLPAWRYWGRPEEADALA